MKLNSHDGIYLQMSKKVAQIIIVIAFILFTGTLTYIAVDNQFNVKVLHANQYYQWVEENRPIIIDLREGNELYKNPLTYQPLINLPFLQIEGRMDSIQIPQKRKVLFVCSDGNRARLICSLLKHKSANIYYLEHGLLSLPKVHKKITHQ